MQVPKTEDGLFWLPPYKCPGWDKYNNDNWKQTSAQMANMVQRLQATIDGLPVTESGNWTPTLSGASATGVWNPSDLRASYGRSGKTVYLRFYMANPKHSNALGIFTIKGLPFIPKDIISFCVAILDNNALVCNAVATLGMNGTITLVSSSGYINAESVPQFAHLMISGVYDIA